MEGCHGDENVFQARKPATARRLTKLIRGRLETMGLDLWKLVRDGKGDVATHAVFVGDPLAESKAITGGSSDE